MRFTKGHGTGNDFVILPDPDGAIALTPELVAALCDRRRGIGADGVLRVVRAAKHPDAAGQAADAEWFMDYWNADGSYAEMCGNGVRVYLRYLLDHGLAAGDRIPVATRGGTKIGFIGAEIAVDLGAPRLGERANTTVGGFTYAGTAVDMGNPHLVCRVSDLDILDLTRAPEVDPASFPDGANVEFATPVADDRVTMRVYERGSGETLSCGTGACAVAAVHLRDAGRDSGTVTVDVPGGRLTVTVDGPTCLLAGPAVLVADGEINLGALVQPDA